jgi:hypothetical protein
VVPDDGRQAAGTSGTDRAHSYSASIGLRLTAATCLRVTRSAAGTVGHPGQTASASNGPGPGISRRPNAVRASWESAALSARPLIHRRRWDGPYGCSPERAVFSFSLACSPVDPGGAFFLRLLLVGSGAAQPHRSTPKKRHVPSWSPTRPANASLPTKHRALESSAVTRG